MQYFQLWVQEGLGQEKGYAMNSLTIISVHWHIHCSLVEPAVYKLQSLPEETKEFLCTC